MFKLLTIGVLLIILYRMIFPASARKISFTKSEELSQNKVEDVDYEEVEEEK